MLRWNNVGQEERIVRENELTDFLRLWWLSAEAASSSRLLISRLLPGVDFLADVVLR